MFDYLMANTPEPDEAKIRLYCDGSLEHFDWLTGHGVPFNDGFGQTKHHEPPTKDCLSWSGNEKAWPISEAAKPAPRGHKVEHEGGEGGGHLVRRLVANAEEQDLRFQYDARVTNLVVNEAGEIAGARYTLFGEQGFVKARKGVVLAAGGFAMNQEMLDEYCPNLAQKGVMKQGNPNDDGAGIQMGLAVSTEGEVLRQGEPAVPRLFASGACASNIAQDGRGYSSGTCIGEASFFGRRAGLHVARQKDWGK